MIEYSRFLIVAIRGTHVRSLTDRAVNKDANNVPPIGFLDEEQNTCHASFPQVAKAMVVQVAEQFEQHPASSKRSTLLFTGHSAGGAVAAPLYSHMLSISVTSSLTPLSDRYSTISYITFGAPPLSAIPLPRCDHSDRCGIYLSLTNEGDPVLRLSNVAYVKSLYKLMTAPPPPASLTGPAVKTVRRSRGSALIRQASVAQVAPWEELPLRPTPVGVFVNAGNVVLLRDGGKGRAIVSTITNEELKEVIFGGLAIHGAEVYVRRMNECAMRAMVGKNLE